MAFELTEEQRKAIVEGARKALAMRSDLPEGIDYALWSRAVKPADHAGFADTLEFVDLFPGDPDGG